MNTLEAIQGRRSVRKYKEIQISDEDLQIILNAAMHAPSAGNSQPWEFIVVKSKEGMEAVAKHNQYAQMALNAPLAIVVCGNLQKEKFPGFWMQDCSAAIQNMMLAAYELEIGTVWTGVYPIEERVIAYKEYFNLPEHIIPLGIVITGYIDQKIGQVDRFDADKIHYEKY